MSLAGILEKLYARRRFGIRPGVDRVRLVLERLGHPERSFRSIHVVGTNGKGSTSAFLAAILSAAGVRTALFTSPHLVNFSERFRIDGQEPPPERLETLLATVLAAAPAEATFFEIVTALAALCFAEERAEVAVMEAGMGGRSDATAVIPALMTVITPIALDHCDYLGATLPLIAAEKSAIAEPGTPVVSARQPAEALEVIRRTCAAGGNRFVHEGDDFRAFWMDDGSLDYHGLGVELSRLLPGIPGRYQSQNASLALTAAEVLGASGMTIAPDALTAGIAAARWPGRMELVPGPPRLLLDGAHNPAGAAALAEALDAYRCRRLILVTGVMSDKDVPAIFAPLAGKVHHAYAVTPAVERALNDAVLAGILNGLGFRATACGSVGNGIETARREAGADDLILVCGSLFTVGETKAWLAGDHFEGIRG
ncbi:bifunctional folylpolyglutamate synthase/dihydrofolate synthase [Geobacter sp. FeAm09]|uniref:bifunctional folylpolyglutamate synthase/dihydrofolate synthase n=1 Tax=Geobacter sp. FeAm09 TaxID=2597769 RepID=UPI0011EDAED6|nr:folylpolyglutamate synthase/dihydrofolate synthase family protein [Geobacter sp. FeAm09]QEM67807.1 bifunctional folylpolyglutamate synthase/dihydrofolate synthase [Geobacter sp. FeAm09]